MVILRLTKEWHNDELLRFYIVSMVMSKPAKWEEKMHCKSKKLFLNITLSQYVQNKNK